jgi:hypothetical protein
MTAHVAGKVGTGVSRRTRGESCDLRGRKKVVGVAVRRCYLEVSEQYKTTPLAVRDGWLHHPTRYGLLEVELLSRYLEPGALLVDIGTGMGIVPRFAKQMGRAKANAPAAAT